MLARLRPNLALDARIADPLSAGRVDPALHQRRPPFVAELHGSDARGASTSPSAPVQVSPEARGRSPGLCEDEGESAPPLSVSPSSADPNGTAGGPKPAPPTRVIRIGRFALEVGAPGGTRLAQPDQALTTVDPELTPALEEADDEIRREEQTPGTTVTEAVDRAEQVTDAVERAGTLFETLAKGGTPDPALLRGEIDSLLDELGELDRSGRVAEAVRLARALEKLLALMERWRELGRTLVTASRLGRAHGDEHAVAWARHELGTLQLAAGNHAEHPISRRRES